MKLKFGDPVKVTWIDACSRTGWDIPYRDGVECIHVGVFVSKSSKGICLARSVEKGDRETVLGPSFIPKGMIRKIRRLH